MKKLREILIENDLKKVSSIHYIHRSGLHIVQMENKKWSVFDADHHDPNQWHPGHELSSYHKSKDDAATMASSIFRRRKKGLTEESDKDFRQDNPGGDWLQRKQEYANKNLHRLGGLTGAVTGYYKKTLKLPTHELHKVRGALGEHEFRDSGDKLSRLEKEVGHPKNFDTSKNPVLIGVNHHGDARVLEGNHRIAYAKKHGIPHVHADVRYWNGGETARGNWHPDKVAKMRIHD